MMDDHPRVRAGRAIRALSAILLIGHAATAGAAAVGSGRHWQMAIEGLQCDVADSVVTMDSRIRYLGGAGLVEAPVLRIVGSEGRAVPPRSLVWKDGSKPLAALISAGGIRSIEPGSEGRMQFRFPLRDAAGDLKLEFGDLKPIVLAKAPSSGAKGVCERLLKTGQVQGAQPARAPLGKGAVPRMRVYRDAYPCREAASGTARTVEAQHPPYPPEQILVFGRGYLPNLREVGLPTGSAAAQSYAYAGKDELQAFEDSARRAVAADFPSYVGSAKHFAFNWGIQRAPNGNELYSVGLYGLRPCAK
jgi:hypothetical protein